METQLVMEFITHTGADAQDAVSCLKSWEWDLKKALIDYNDTSTTEYFNSKKHDNELVNAQSTSPSSYKKHHSLHQKTNDHTALLKPILTKTDSIDIFDCKKLARGISRATENVNLVSKVRQEFEMDFHTNCHEQNVKNMYFIDTPDYTFTLPDLTKYSDEFRKFLEKDLIESSTLNSLEQTQRLNWWYDSGACRKLWPLATTGDGNCLLHAASLAMWGFHDRRLTLRRTLHDILSKEEFRDALYRRWRFQQTRLNKQAGFVFSETEWAKEWEEIVAIASPEPRHNSKCNSRRRSLLMEKSIDLIDDVNAVYESLEEIHVLALSHILRRTIIVVSDVFLRDMNGEAFSPIPFGGVYLPFEVPSNECHRAPLLLTYDMAHFSALVAMETPNDYPAALIPLTDSTNQLLPIQFCIDPGRDFDWREYDGSDGNWILTDREHIALLKEYLDIVNATTADSPDDEIYEDYSDEEFEKKMADSELVFSDENHNNGTAPMAVPVISTGANNKSKAAKQLQSVAKQFGSIGKSVSKKLKKNIGSITRIGSKNNHNKKSSISSDKSSHHITKFRILCAQLKARRHEYQEEMIKNYLECAHERFIESEKMRERRELEKLHKYDSPKDNCDYVDGNTDFVNCINAGCLNYGTVSTSYMCPECYETQRKRETHCNVNEYSTRYGTGKSKFYTQSDMESHNRIQRLPSVRRLNELDQTLYLSKSTFYNDRRPDIGVVPINTNAAIPSSAYRHGFSPTESSSAISKPSYKFKEVIDKNGHNFTTDFPACAKNAATNSTTTSGIVASVYSPGNTIGISRNAMCVTLPPPSSSLPTSSSMSSSSSSGSNATFTDTKYQEVRKNTTTPQPGYNDIKNQLCRTEGCMYYGSINTKFYCSKCCQEFNI